MNLSSFRPLLSLLAAAGIVAPIAVAQTLSPELLPAGPVTIIAGGASSNPAAGAKCSAGSTAVSTDAYGSGCQGTQVAVSGARFVVPDSQGNLFIADYGNNILRRVDAITGVVSRVAGGASSSPAAAAVCGAGVSTDIFGDGCNSTLVALSKPLGMAFAANGDLYFVDSGHDVIRKITAVGGVIPATGGIISSVAGHAPTTGSAGYGYVVSNSTTSVIAATSSYIDAPFGIRFNANGVLFATEEYKNAIYAINVTATPQTVYGITLLPGQIWKVVGTTTGGANSTTSVDCPNGTSGTYGCNYGTYAEGGFAPGSLLDSPFDVAFDPGGNLYIANEYIQVLPQVTAAGRIATFAGKTSGYGGDSTKRAAAGSFGIGSDFGVTTNANGVVYFTDALSGVVWRVDPDTKTQYAVAGLTGTKPGSPSGAICASGDSLGNGCPALQASFGRSGSSYATATNPGLFGISADAYDNLYVGDSITNEARMIGTGQNFGTATTTKLFVHYFQGDSPRSSGGYTVTSAGSVISITGTPACSANADTSYDCEVDLLVQTTVVGPFSGTFTATSATGRTLTVPLTGTFAPTPVTSIRIASTAATTCSGTTYSTTTPVTLTATITSVGGYVTGTVQFYDNGVAIGSPVTPASDVATLTQTFAAGNHSVTAVYSGDTYFKTSTTATPTTFATSTPAFGVAQLTPQRATVSAGGTALYSFAVNSNVYAGTVSFACSGLPAGASCVFSPQTVTATGCTGTQTVALSIFTTQATPIRAGGFGSLGRGPWNVLAMLGGLLTVSALSLRRRRMAAWMHTLGMLAALAAIGSGLVACSGMVAPSGGTPSGTYSVTVTATGSPTAPATASGSQSLVVPLTIQ